MTALPGSDLLAAFQPLDLAELFALELPKTEWAVDGILPLGSAALLSAREKAGKGLLALDLCASIASGEPWLDRAVQEGAAIYCAAEEHLRDVRARLAVRLGDRRDLPLYVLPLDGSTPDRLKLDDPVGMQRLWAMVETLEPVLVVLDTLRELHDRKEDLSDEMGPLLRPVRQLAHQTNTTVLVNHHHNKGGAFRGSTAIRAAFDLEWAFARTDDPDAQGAVKGLLRVEGRHGPRTLLGVRLEEELRWRLDQSASAMRDAGIRAQILARLDADNDWRTAAEIAAALGAPLKTIQNTLTTMRRETPAPCVMAGAGAKNDPRRYRALTTRLNGFDATQGDEMIPPNIVPLGRQVGRNQMPADEAGADRWTR